MSRPICAALLTLSLATSAFAADTFAGEPFLLSNTRYGPVYGAPMLLSNDRDLVLFWNSGTRFRATRVGSGEAGPSHSLLRNAGGSDSYSVVWTGSHFLMVAARRDYSRRPYLDDIVGQLIDANGEATGKPFVLYSGGGASPHIAFDGTSALLLFTPGEEIFAGRLSPDGHWLPSETLRTGVEGWTQSLAGNGKSYAAVVRERWSRKVVMFDRNGKVTKSTPLNNDDRGVGLIATDGNRYLIADGALNKLTTQFIEPDGTLGEPLELVPRGAWEIHPIAVAWSGSRWVVAYTERQYSSDVRTFTIAHLNAKTRAVEESETARGDVASMVARGGKVTLAWLPGTPAGIRVGESPIAMKDAVTESHASMTQHIRATASASHGTLVLWEENGALHSGVRSSDGGWRERELAIGRTYEVMAASDGEGFAAVITAPNTNIVQRFDRDGNPAGEPVKLNWTPEQILWTGRDYLLSRAERSGLEVATFSRSGVLSPRRSVDLGLSSASARLASNGNGFYVVWIAVLMHYTSPPMPPAGLKGMQLSADLTPVGTATEFVDPETYVFGADVAWDGTQYVVAWSNWDGVHAARVPAQGGAIATQELTDVSSHSVNVQSIDGGVVLDWIQNPPYSDDETPHLSFLSASGTPTTPVALPFPEYLGYSAVQHVTPLAGGNVALIESAIVDDAPADGVARVRMLVVSRNALPQRPAAPQAFANLQNGTIDLRWIAPPQTVHGYRVEYRRDDGAWTELETTIPADQRSVLIESHGKKLTLRVRAWNESGPGAYSTPVVVDQRRPVRLKPR